MLRLLSIILLLAGAGIAALGGWLYMGNDLPPALLGQKEIVLEQKAAPPAEAPAAAEAPEPQVAAAFEPIEAIEMAPVEIEAPAPAEDATPRSRSLTLPEPEDVVMPEAAPMADEPVFTTETMAMDDGIAPPPAPTRAITMPEPPTLQEQLIRVPIAYETPASASFNQSFTVTLAINAQDGAETATGGLPQNDGATITENTAEVTDTVKANLYGEAFTITTSTPDIQRLSKSTESRWRWEVTPTKSGPQDLTFEIYAMHDGNASELVRTFNDTVTIEVSRIGQAMFLAQQYNPLIVIFAGMGSLLAGLFGVLRFFRGS